MGSIPGIDPTPSVFARKSSKSLNMDWSGAVECLKDLEKTEEMNFKYLNGSISKWRNMLYLVVSQQHKLLRRDGGSGYAGSLKKQMVCAGEEPNVYFKTGHNLWWMKYAHLSTAVEKRDSTNASKCNDDVPEANIRGGTGCWCEGTHWNADTAARQVPTSLE